MDLTPLLATEPPWILEWGLAPDLLLAEEEAFRETGLFVVRLQCARMARVAGVFREFQRGLEFPSYFGHNWDAMDECLADLDWLDDRYGSVRGYVLILEGARHLLAREQDSRLGTFHSVLVDAAAEFAEPISIGSNWDRDARPFHALLVEGDDEGPSLISRLRRLNLEVGRFG